MNKNLQILFDFLRYRLPSTTPRTRHLAFRWLLPTEATTETSQPNALDWLVCLGRPRRREWNLGMTSMTEQAYCEWYASRLYTGKGKIVELGAWLGALTIALATGLRRNKGKPGPNAFHAYDLFIWHHSFETAVRGTSIEAAYKEGADFYPLYLQTLASVRDLVTPHKADLVTETWSGGPIEFLLVDAMKYEALVQNIQGAFFPSLLPGTGILMHQDFMHFYESWIHVAMYLLRDRFEPVCALPDSGTFIFRCKTRPDADELRFPEKVADLPRELIEDAYEWAAGLVPPEQRDTIAAAHTMMYVHRAEFNRAMDLFERYCTRGLYHASAEFATMANYVATYCAMDLRRGLPTQTSSLEHTSC